MRPPHKAPDVVVYNPTEEYKANIIALDKPQEDQNIRGDAFKTLIVARLSYDATEQDLEREFGRFGPIERVCIPILQYLLYCANVNLQIRIVTDTHQDEKPNKKKKKHRGYAFVVFEREKDMRGKAATYTPNPTFLPRRSIDLSSLIRRVPKYPRPSSLPTGIFCFFSFSFLCSLFHRSRYIF